MYYILKLWKLIEFHKIVIYIGEKYAIINSEKVKLDSPTFIENDRTCTPIRFISEELCTKV